MHFQIASDFHLEKLKDYDINELIKPSAPYLVLAGDIGSLYRFDQLKEFLERICKLFVGVLYIPGNHEFYTIKGQRGVNFIDLIKKLESLEKYIDNLYILNRQVVKIDKYCFIGCILWSHCPEEEKFPTFRVKIHNFNKNKYNRFNKEDISFVNNAVNVCIHNGFIPIVVTHYPPSKKLLNKKNIKNGYNYLYANDLEHMLDGNNIPIWICGHTHWCFDLISDNGTRLLGNQKGTKKNDTTYQNDYVISIN